MMFVVQWTMAQTQQSITVKHEKGLHARPASTFVRTASEFEASITVGRNGSDDRADAKSSISVMALGIKEGDEITITAAGPDSEEAVCRLIELVEEDFRF